MPAEGVAARAAAARRGGSRSGPAWGREGGGKAGEGTWLGAERRWGSRASGERPARAAGRRREEQRRKGLEEEEGDCFVIFQECRGLTEMYW
jgi:hypothetical protein